MTLSKPRDEASAWMSGTYPTQKLKLRRAIVKEQLSTLTETTIEFLCENTGVNLSEIVGQIMTVHSEQDGNDEGRKFTGTCISVEAMGMRDGKDHFVAQVRPWLWMLTMARNIRVFQDKSVTEIIQEVLSEHEFSDYEIKASETYAKREYCVQYRETDFAFLSRLMEEEGLYYFFDHSAAMEKNEKLIICDGISAHEDVEGGPELVFKPKDAEDTHSGTTINEWAAAQDVTRGKISLTDYDFEVPGVRQMQTTSIEKGNHAHKNHEYYDNLGHYRSETTLGKTRTRVRAEADAIKHLQYRGAGDIQHFGAGYLFALTEHPEDKNNADYLITEAVHFIQDSEEQADNAGNSERGEEERWFAIKPRNIEIPKEIDNAYSFTFSAVLKEHPYRAQPLTPWPEIPGIQIGEVVGPASKEIHTDKYGRIKVLFRWDRINEPDDNASCWIRVASQWSGNEWGLLSIPRIGQEVIIQFEDGDPDRPICTGMMYHKEKMPPFADLDNREELRQEETLTGIKTRSSPEGGESDYNALIFEDDKDKEFVHVQAQKDYQMVVKNSAQITIGDDGLNIDQNAHDAEDGSLLQTVKNHVTEMVQEGDKTETVDQGKLDLTVEGNMTELVRSGNMSLDVERGTITMTAAQKITLQVGQSSIVIDPGGVTITGSATVNVDSIRTKVSGSAMLTLTGGMVNIN